MELLDRYLQAVKFWLPKSQREDIIAELSEDIRSQLEEKEAELGRKLGESDVEAVLKSLGHPLLIAERYLPTQQYLIGPVLFPHLPAGAEDDDAGLCRTVALDVGVLVDFRSFLSRGASRSGTDHQFAFAVADHPLFVLLYYCRIRVCGEIQTQVMATERLEPSQVACCARPQSHFVQRLYG